MYLKRNIISLRIEARSGIYCNGCSSDNFSFPIYAILEVENEFGFTNTLKCFRGSSYYSWFYIQGTLSSRRAYFSFTCPTFLIGIQGPHIRVSAMTFQDKATSIFLTNIINVVHSNSIELAFVFKALKLSLDSLETF